MALLALGLALVGCGENRSAGAGRGGPQAETAGAGGEGGHEHEEAAGADFQADTGIELSDEARATIGLETAKVARRKLALEFSATARVFHAAHQHADEFSGSRHGFAYANAMIPPDRADMLKAGQAVELSLPAVAVGGKLPGRLSSLDRETTRAIGQVEAVIEISDPDERLKFGAFLTARFAVAERSVLAVPRSALVDAATSTFVYIQHGARWRRTPVRAGGSTEDFVEILDGLSEGETVVSKGATDLWLVELRFTKGGGHVD